MTERKARARARANNRFPSGMTERNARAKANARARATADSLQE
jgi:hypothetical protein